MSKRHRPRRGSLQFWPRKRSKRPYAKIRSWAEVDGIKLLGFCGYKVGMTHVQITDESPSITKGETISQPVTVLECPPLKTLSIRFYKKTDYGLKILGESFSKNLDKELKRRINLPKKSKETKEFDDLRLVVYTQPKLTKLEKKKPEIFEIAISGDKNKKLEYAKTLLDKEIKIKDIFKEGQLLDVHSVTKGKGFQGTVKRFGVSIRQHKAEKTKRGIGTLGSWTPKKVSWRVPQTGKTGFNLRTEYNKWLMKIGNNPKEINPKGGFYNYGFIKNDFILLKGSVSGTKKRLILLSEPRRPKRSYSPKIDYINLEIEK